MKLDLTLRLRDHSSQISQTCRSDTMEAAADGIMRRSTNSAGSLRLPAAVPEKELWRRQALYLMPQRCETWSEAIVPNFAWSSKSNNHERTIRAWENVLLLDAEQPEAMTYLGVCLIGFNRRVWNPDKAARAGAAPMHCRIATGRACRCAAIRTRSSSRHFYRVYRTAQGRPPRPAAKEMAQYVVEHPGQFRTRTIG